MHEVNASGQGSNRIDVIAVTRDEIIAVEIKSKKDKLDRLPTQMAAMKRVSHHAFAAIHEKFLIKSRYTPEVARRVPFLIFGESRRGPWGYDLPPEAPRWQTLIWPRVRRHPVPTAPDEFQHWKVPEMIQFTALPGDAIHILWREELFRLAERLRLSPNSKATMTTLVRDIRWLATGREITEGICRELRRRTVIEGDDPIADS